MSLLRLVRHLAGMERATFRVMLAGQDVPRLFCSETDRNGDFDDSALPCAPGGCGRPRWVGDERRHPDGGGSGPGGGAIKGRRRALLLGVKCREQ